MASSSFAGLSGGILAGAAVAVALAAGGYFFYKSQQDSAVEPVALPVQTEPQTGNQAPAEGQAAVSEAGAGEAAEPATDATEAAEAPITPEATAPSQEAASAPAPESPDSQPPAAQDQTAVASSTASGAAASEPQDTASEPAAAQTEPGTQAQVASQAQAEADAQAAPQAQAPATDSSSVATEQAPVELKLLPPTFDIVRIDAEGNALVAGAGQPNAAIAVLLDRTEIATTAADTTGKFVAMFSVDPSPQPRVVSLVMVKDGLRVGSDESVIIEPVSLPVATAEAAEPEAESVAQAAATTPSGAETTASASETSETETPASRIEQAEAQPAEAPAEAVEATEAPAQTAAPQEQPAAAKPAPRVLLADTSGVRVLQDGADAGVLSIDTVGYTATGDVQIAGRGLAGQTVRLYLDGAAVSDAPVDEGNGWSMVLAGVAPGIYTLRADEIGADGKVTARTEIPFKRESAEVLAEALGTAAPETSEPQEAETDEPVEAVANQTETAQAGATQESPQAQTETAEAGAVAELADQSALTSETSASASASAEATTQIAVSAEDAQPAGPVIVTVQPGFTLWGIASQTYGDGLLYVKVFEANADQIRNPDLIYPGQIFTVPE